MQRTVENCCLRESGGIARLDCPVFLSYPPGVTQAKPPRRHPNVAHLDEVESKGFGKAGATADAGGP